MDGGHTTEASRVSRSQRLEGVAHIYGDAEPAARSHHGRVGVHAASLHARVAERLEELPAAAPTSSTGAAPFSNGMYRHTSEDLGTLPAEELREARRGGSDRSRDVGIDVTPDGHSQWLALGQPVDQPAEHRELLVQPLDQRVGPRRESRKSLVANLLAQGLHRLDGLLHLQEVALDAWNPSVA